MSDTAKVKRPASQYYWGDWWKDKGLHSCSLTARGLWHEMNCLMHEGEPYGHLTLNGKPMTTQQLANQCRITPSQCTKLVQELEDAGVFSRAETGAVFSRRMVRDEKLREQRAEIGKASGAKGAGFGALGAEHGAKGGRPRKETPADTGGGERGQKPPQNPHPSSSSSSSSSPSGEKKPTASSAAKLPPCPHDQLVELYHEVLPEMPAIRLMNDGRKRVIAKVWQWVLTSETPEHERRATNAEEALAWFRRYFDRARDNDFLMGRTPRSGPHANWKCDLDFLLTEKGMRHVIEKTGDDQ